jgi:hypothetical protein
MEINMPNWVYNKLHCHGSQSDLDTLAAFFEMDVEVHTWNPQMGTDDLVTEHVPFTYMSMRNPFLPPYNVSHEEYHSTNGFSDGVQTGNTSGNWYNWNSRVWGVKWDAKMIEMEREDELLSYSFESPWGPPDPEMLLEMSEQFPTIAFTHYYEEEQGWGGEYEFQNGNTSEAREWDIPNSHAEKMDLGQTCNCEIWGDDYEWMFDDCPAKIESEKKELQNS